MSSSSIIIVNTFGCAYLEIRRVHGDVAFVNDRALSQMILVRDRTAATIVQKKSGTGQRRPRQASDGRTSLLLREVSSCSKAADTFRTWNWCKKKKHSDLTKVRENITNAQDDGRLHGHALQGREEDFCKALTQDGNGMTTVMVNTLEFEETRDPMFRFEMQLTYLTRHNTVNATKVGEMLLYKLGSLSEHRIADSVGHLTGSRKNM